MKRKEGDVLYRNKCELDKKAIEKARNLQKKKKKKYRYKKETCYRST